MNRIISPIRAYIKCVKEIAELFLFVSGSKDDMYIVIDEKENWNRIYKSNKESIEVFYFETLANNSLYGLKDLCNSSARVEFGAIIRDNVTLSDSCIVLMGAVINVGAVIGDGTMIDMNAVIGSGAKIGNNCHVSAGVVIAGVLEPISTKSVIIEDNVFIGANAVILEGVRIGKGSIIGAGSIVTKDIPENCVAIGNPARIIRNKSEEDENKTKINKSLRK